VSEILFVASNLVIVLGYVFLAAVVVPRMTIRLNRTRWGGIVFFLTCALTHLDMIYHYVFASGQTISDVYGEPHMLLIHIPQAIAVWAFVTGLYAELVRWGPWGIDPEREDADADDAP
jgi:hypothetical protein